MNRFSGLENDVTYLQYVEIKERLIKAINEDDITHVQIYVECLQYYTDVLNKIKEYRDGESRNIITEVGESN